MNVATSWRAIADGSRTGFLASCVTCLLAPAAFLYGMVLSFRALAYQRGMLTVHRLPCPVVAIGNITVGGTGKTPLTALVAQELLSRGLRVVVLSRGYGGSLEGQTAVVSDGVSLFLSPEQAGDEPCLLAATVPGLMVVIGADRYQAGLLALEQLKPDIMLLDDGFQHIRLYRDLNILLLDAARPFGNGWTLPLGLLREPRSALGRADLAIFTRCQGGGRLPKLSIPFCRASHRLTSFHLVATGDELPIAQLRQGRVAAFAGIADPAVFFEGLKQLGIEPVAVLSLPDHEPYQDTGMVKLSKLFEYSKADWLLTTEKDGVKLQAGTEKWHHLLVTARLEVQLEDDGLLQQNLDKLLSS